VDLSGLVYGSLAGSCEHDHEPDGCHKKRGIS